MKGQMNPVARFFLFSGALFATLLVCGVITRPLALLLPGMYAFHAVLMALPSAFVFAFCLRKGAHPATCVVAVGLFAFVLSCMSPLMGWAAVAPLVIAGVVWVATQRLGGDGRARMAGFVFGATYYPCTIALSAALGGMAVSLDGGTLVKLVASLLLGVALSWLGALLASGKSPSEEGV